MSLRLRLGPFTVGKTGVRLSVWKRRGGFSMPIPPSTKKGKRTLGVLRIGPFRWFF
jgi:hypothetical protein